MPRLLGIDIPGEKPTHISLRYIYGIGPTLAIKLCEQAGVDPQRRAKELNEDEISRLSNILDREYVVEGPLRRQTKYCPSQGYWIVPGVKTSKKSSCTRSKNENKCTHPQRTQENSGWQEGCQGIKRLIFK
jgi:predicted ribosome quality control (RQC) complex YloA/Tae2 family protein